MDEVKYQQYLEEIKDAMYRGDTEWLDQNVRCECCCGEHTFGGCPARIVGTCRGQGSLDHYDIQKWADHYGMTLDEFYGVKS